MGNRGEASISDSALSFRDRQGVISLAGANELDRFLASIQSRAYAIAKTATGHEADALDIVQDAMLKLVKSYSERPADEWRMLFYRILRNRINDYFRRRKVRDKILGWLPGSYQNKDEAEREDPFQNVADTETSQPDVHLERLQNVERLQVAIQKLPRRQSEAFVLRCWEGLSTAETAATMQCSEGSVKTHYSRAMRALRVQLSTKDEK